MQGGSQTGSDEHGGAHPLRVAKAARVAQRHPAAPLGRVRGAAGQTLALDRLLDRLDDAGLELALPAAHRMRRIPTRLSRRGRQRLPPAQRSQPLTYMCDKDEHGTVIREAKGHAAVVAHLRSRWKGVLNMDWDADAVRADMEAELQHVRDDLEAKVPQRMIDAGFMSTTSMFHKDNIKKAVKRLKRGSSPGLDGVSADLALCLVDSADFVHLLQTVFLEWHKRGSMNESSKTAVLTTMWKEKGTRADWTTYRPVSVTTILYRIYGGCLEQQLSAVLHHLVADPQVGYARGRRLDENINLVLETIRYINHDAPAEGGLLLLLDNMKAFDRVQWSLMFATLRAFGVPEDFVRGVEVMYTDVYTSLKVNGQCTPSFRVTSGIRQGCVLSALLYLLVQEVQMRMIRRNTAINGVRIPGPDGLTTPGNTDEVKERGLVDDMLVMLRGARDLGELMSTIKRFQHFSNHEMQMSKSVLVLLGKYADVDPFDPTDTSEETDTLRRAITECGIEPGHVITLSGDRPLEVPKWHGVKPANDAGIVSQWDTAVRRATDTATALAAARVVNKDGARGREMQAR